MCVTVMTTSTASHSPSRDAPFGKEINKDEPVSQAQSMNEEKKMTGICSLRS